MARRYEAKGSTFFRSDHMDYCHKTLVPERGLDWHAAREANPKDHTVHMGEGFDAKTRNLKQSTYNALGNVRDQEVPQSTTHYHMQQIQQKDDYKERRCKFPMIDASTFNETETTRDTSASSSEFGSILPRYSAEHDKRYLNTTYVTDYKYGYPYEESNTRMEEKDNTAAFKRCRSQFTDTADYHRIGKNTWQDESGQYANSELKKSNPIPERV